MTVHMCPSQECAANNHGKGWTTNTTNDKIEIKAWICPRCDSVNSPYTVSCPNCSHEFIRATYYQDKTSGCPCRRENGGSGVCGCVLGNQVIS